MHHVFAHAIAEGLLFVERDDYEAYLDQLERVVEKYGWLVLSYCLMTNHVHLLVTTPEPNLGLGMQDLHGRYARGFNARHGQRGARFREGYGSARILTDRHFYSVARYLPINPVRAGICVRPEDYAWASYGALVRGEAPSWMGHGELLLYLRTLDRYIALVETALPVA